MKSPNNTFNLTRNPSRLLWRFAILPQKTGCVTVRLTRRYVKIKERKMQSDNPAARLYSILEDGKKISPNSACRTAWQELLNVDSDDQALLMSRLGKFMELPNQVIEAIKSDFPMQIKTCDHWNSQVNKAFMVQNINDKWASFINHIDDHALAYLSMTTELIQTVSETKLLDENEIEKIRNSINDVLEETMKSDISNEIKIYISKWLHKLLINIDEYRITGAQPIMDGVETMFGHAFSDSEYRKYLSETNSGKSLVNVLAVIASSITIVLGVPQLPEAFSDILKLVKK